MPWLRSPRAPSLRIAVGSSQITSRSRSPPSHDAPLIESAKPKIPSFDLTFCAPSPSIAFALGSAEMTAEITDLDDLAVRQRVAASPSDAVRGPIPVCIDEYQHVPELLQAIKAELNKHHENGRWLLSGSASF